MLPVLSHSAPFKKDPPLKSVSNYAGNIKVPILSRISLRDGLSLSLKGPPRRGEASEPAEVRLPRGPPLNLGATSAPDWTGGPRVVTETLWRAISWQSGGAS